jgi:signal transduction histidine kinase
MRVAQRLFLAVIPAVLGVFAMAGLAYWGQRGREIPHALLWMGIAAAVVSLVLAWRNTRYVARRIEALSRRRGEGEDADRPADELDSIERAMADAERRGASREEAAEALVREYAGLLADASATVGRRLDEVRMPLHILLASPFGALNENQEEMIGAAHAAAGEADEALRMIGRIAELDAGRVESRPEPIRPRDLLEPVLAAAAPRIAHAGAVLEVDLPPDLPRAAADAGHAREALSLVLDRLAARTSAGARVRIAAEAADGALRLRIEADSIRGAESFPLAQRLLRLQGGELAAADGVVVIRLPAASPA